MGRIGGKAILYFEIITTIALFVGLGAVNLVQPGLGVQLQKSAATPVPAAASTLPQILEHTFPTSIVDSMAKGEVLQIVVFAFIFGAACAAVGSKARPVVGFCESLAAVMFKYTNYVMLFAPFGVFGAMASTIGDKGLGVLTSLGKLVLALYAAQAFFVVFVFGAVIMLARILSGASSGTSASPSCSPSPPPQRIRPPHRAQNMERFGVPKHIVAFVLPTGYSFNLDGSALYLSMAALFVAQAAGVTWASGRSCHDARP